MSMSQHSEKVQNTINFYDKNAEEYIRSTSSLDMSQIQHRFLSRLEKGQKILDAGCGSGRDSKAFLDLGFDVVSIDASREMTRATQRLTGVVAHQLLLQDLAFENEYNGIWACASLLHIPLAELPDVLGRLARALKRDGVLYISFKHGNGERITNGRLFTDLTETSLNNLVTSQPILASRDFWLTEDSRADSPARWLNLILQKRDR